MLDQLDKSTISLEQTEPASPTAGTEVSFLWICDSLDQEFAATLEQYLKAIPQVASSYEFIVVSNGLGTRQLRLLKSVLDATDVPVTLTQLRSRCPQSSALSAGIEELSGNVLVILPPYAQCDPLDVSRMIQLFAGGYDYVGSWRRERVDGWVGSCRSRIYNYFARRIFGIHLHDINSGLRVMRRAVVEEVAIYGDLHRFLPILAAQHGFRITELPVQHLEERTEPDGRGAGAYLRRLLDLFSLFFLLRFTYRPFRFFGGIGAGLISTGALITIVLGIQRLLGESLADRPMLVLGVLLLVLGIQMLSVGLIGELLIFTSAGQLKNSYVRRVYETAQESADEARC